jgi:hypothetical protein
MLWDDRTELTSIRLVILYHDGVGLNAWFKDLAAVLEIKAKTSRKMAEPACKLNTWLTMTQKGLQLLSLRAGESIPINFF